MISFNKSSKYKSIAIYAGIALSFVVILYLILTNLGFFTSAISKISRICSPLIYGFIFAYLCNPILKFFESKVFSFKKRKLLTRPLSLLATVFTVIILLAAFFIIVFPQIAASYKELESQIGTYVSAAQSWADKFFRDFSFFNGRYENLSDFLDVNEITTDIKQIISNSYDLLEQLTNYLFSYAGRFVVEMKNIIMGIIIAIYFLYSKERICAKLKKFFNAVLSRKHYLNLITLTRYTDKTFGGFVTGKIIDSIIIGLLTFIVMSIFRFPFAPLISLIIGVTNVIPFFGPFIGAIPSAFIIFIADPGKTIWFILMILVIQQLDGNVIGPKIIGDSTGMSSLSVLISITIASGLFGITGMILGVPAGAVICALFKQMTEYRLKKKGAPTEIDFYMTDPPFYDKNQSSPVIIVDSSNVQENGQNDKMQNNK